VRTERPIIIEQGHQRPDRQNSRPCRAADATRARRRGERV